MHHHPKASLVVLNYNSLEKLGPQTTDYLQSISETDYPNLEIVIVDNASTDGSLERIEEMFRDDARVKIIKLGQNLGYAGGNNGGARTASDDSKYLAFLNNDVVVENDWLTKIIDVMEADETIGAAQPKIMQLKNPELVDSLGGFVDRTGRAYDAGHGLRQPNTPQTPYQVFYARGAAIVVRKKLFERLGGFDEDYFIYFEETDLCWRLRLLGYKVVAVPQSKIYHLGGGTTGGPKPEIVHLSRRNQLTTLVKNYSAPNMIRYATQLSLTYLLYSLLNVFRPGRMKLSVSVASAVLWNIANLKRTIRKRAVVQAMRRVSDEEIMKVMLTRERYDLLTRYLTRSY